MGLIGGFVGTEPDVPVKPKKGFVDPRIGLHPRGNLFQPGSQGHYEIPGGDQDLLFIIFLVLIKPPLVVVLIEVSEKSQDLFGKSCKKRGRGHGFTPCRLVLKTRNGEPAGYGDRKNFTVVA
jgi:hypothetical protein